MWAELKPFEDLRAEEESGKNVSVVKKAMNLVGLSGGAVREPSCPLDERDRERVKAILRSWKLLRA